MGNQSDSSRSSFSNGSVMRSVAGGQMLRRAFVWCFAVCVPLLASAGNAAAQAAEIRVLISSGTKISLPEASRRTLPVAKSITFSNRGSSGIHFAGGDQGKGLRASPFVILIAALHWGRSPSSQPRCDGWLCLPAQVAELKRPLILGS